LLQAAADAATGTSSTGEVFRADCSGQDFSINVDLGLGIILPTPDGGLMKPYIFFQALSGCRKNKAFADIGFGLGLDRGVLGAPPEIKQEQFMKIGFNIGTPASTVTSVGAAIKLALAIDLKSVLGFDIAGVLGFPILPSFKTPKGFTVVLKSAQGLGLLQESGAGNISGRVQQAIDDTVDYDDKVTAAYSAFATELAGLDLERLVQRAVPQPRALFERGTAAAAAVTSEDMVGSPLKPNCLAGLAFKFCLTCIPDVKEALPDLATTLDQVQAPEVAGMVGQAQQFPDCLPDCMDGQWGPYWYQRPGEIYQVNETCYEALDNCAGCLQDVPDYYPESLASVPCQSMWIYPECQSQSPGCLEGGTHLRQHDLYRVSGSCYRANDNCYGCISSPTSYPASLQAVRCPDETVTAYSYPDCSATCLSEGLYQRVGVTYKVSGTCYRATGGCLGCLANPGNNPDTLAEVPCP